MRAYRPAAHNWLAESVPTVNAAAPPISSLSSSLPALPVHPVSCSRIDQRPRHRPPAPVVSDRRDRLTLCIDDPASRRSCSGRPPVVTRDTSPVRRPSTNSSLTRPCQATRSSIRGERTAQGETNDSRGTPPNLPDVGPVCERVLVLPRRDSDRDELFTSEWMGVVVPDEPRALSARP